MLLVTERMLTACLLNGREAVVCALSGGPDSTALLLELKRLRDEKLIGPLYAAHFEHGIRGAESQDDLAFCRKLCLDLGVPLFSESGIVPLYAEENSLSQETAARKLRYSFLRGLKKALGAGCIALGHHQDDQAETVLMHLVRGSGMKGLLGMAPRSGDLVRPLLDSKRAEILGYLAERRQPYRLDSTNLSSDYARNRLRHDVMPALSSINPRAAEHIASCAERLRAEDAYLDSLARSALEETGASRHALASLPDVLRDRTALVLIRQVTDDFTEADVSRLSRLFSLPSGRSVPLRGHLVARADGDRLIISPDRMQEPFCTDIAAGDTVQTPWGTYLAEWTREARVPCAANEAYLDADRIAGRLQLRQARAGDRFKPLGMKGSKLLSDYYTDRKMDFDARRMPIVSDEAGPVFIPGGTVADRVKIDNGTKRIFHIIVEKGENSYAELGH